MSSFLHREHKYTLHNGVKRGSIETAAAQEAALNLAPPITVEVQGVCVCVGGGESLRSSTARETTENTGFLFFPALKQVLMSGLVSPVEMLP